MMARAGSSTEGSSTGVTSRPSRKKMSTWATSVTTSKKWTRLRFWGSLVLPM